jgi:hypothetical protein
MIQVLLNAAERKRQRIMKHKQMTITTGMNRVDAVSLAKRFGCTVEVPHATGELLIWHWATLLEALLPTYDIPYAENDMNYEEQKPTIIFD